MKRINVFLIFFCLVCVLSPINAQTITSDHDVHLFIYNPALTPVDVVSVVRGETAHFTVQLVANNQSIPVGNQVISMRILECTNDGNGPFFEVNVPNFQSKLITGTNGKADLAINTHTLSSGPYIVNAYYAGNQNDINVDPENKLNSAKSVFSGILVINKD